MIEFLLDGLAEHLVEALLMRRGRSIDFQGKRVFSNLHGLLAANAGHEYPAVRKADGMFELLKDKHGMVAGVMQDMKYTEYEMEIEEGGCLFVYTDGVPEATNAQNQLFGTDRMVAALNREPSAPPEQLLINVKGAVDEFVGEAPQFDDLTMLAMERKLL